MGNGDMDSAEIERKIAETKRSIRTQGDIIRGDIELKRQWEVYLDILEKQLKRKES